MYHAHALPAAACRRFDEYGKPDLPSDLERFLRIRHRMIYAGNHGDIIGFNGFFCSQLAPHQLDGMGAWTDKAQIICFA